MAAKVILVGALLAGCLTAPARAAELECRQVAAWDVISDLVAYELPRNCAQATTAVDPENVFELRRISTGELIDVADCAIRYALGAKGPPPPCNVVTLVRDRKPFTRLRPAREGELLVGDSLSKTGLPKTLPLPGGEKGNVSVDLGALGATVLQAHATASHLFVLIAERSPARSAGTLETLLRVPRADAQGHGAVRRRQQRDLLQHGVFLTSFTVAPLGARFFEAAHDHGPLDVAALGPSLCARPDIVERLETWRAAAAQIPEADRVSTEKALGAAGCFGALDPKAYDAASHPMQIALEWFDAARRHDRARVLALTGVPLVVHGWWDWRKNETEFPTCGIPSRMHASPREAGAESDVRAEDRADLPRVVDCIVQADDAEGLPELVNGRWPPNHENPFERMVGTIYPVEPRRVSKLVRPWALEAAARARGGVLLEAIAGDNNGETLALLIAVVDDRVRAVYLNHSFEH